MNNSIHTTFDYENKHKAITLARHITKTLKSLNELGVSVLLNLDGGCSFRYLPTDILKQAIVNNEIDTGFGGFGAAEHKYAEYEICATHHKNIIG